MPTNFNEMRECLQQFDFHRLFIEHLGWSQPTSKHAESLSVKDQTFTRRQIAQLAGVMVFEVVSDNKDTRIPDAKVRAAVHKEISKSHHENLLIFLDPERTQSLWYWCKRQDGKLFPRDHFFTKGQPGDLFISKLSGIVFDIGEFDPDGNVPVVEVAQRLRNSLDVERVIKKFYNEYQILHIEFLELIEGIDDERQKRWYASVLLNRLMFIYFLQRKLFLNNGDSEYLQNKLRETKKKGKDLYYKEFLSLLFFEGFAKPEGSRSPEAKKALGAIRYLNGGLFLPHIVEQQNSNIRVPDIAFENLFALFGKYSWNLNDTPGGNDNEINPDVLGYIFEKYINQKEFGAYYTRTEITEYLCEHTIHNLILDAVNTPQNALPIPGLKTHSYKTMSELLIHLDVELCRQLIHEVLPKLSLLDPACGSGAFLAAAMKTLINVYSAVIGKIKFLHDRNLSDWLRQIERDHSNLAYYIKKKIITDNLYGVDIMEESTEIARLRLFLALVASAESVDQLEPLPNIDFNILSGNSLVGLMRVDGKEFDKCFSQGDLFHQSYPELLKEKNRLIKNYRGATSFAEDLQSMRNTIQETNNEAQGTLNVILHKEFDRLAIRYEQATWDTAKKKTGKPIKRLVSIQDVEQLQPFHWGYVFDEILNKRGGFDAIITNPPWEVFQTNEKEFFQEYFPEIQKNKIRIEDWKKQFGKYMGNVDLRNAWNQYASKFPFQSKYFKSAIQYVNQISYDNEGNIIASKINLFKLFIEQSFNLLRPNGYCGLVIPNGIYSDLGAKQLREMLFSKTHIAGLFGFENRKFIFENVDCRFKFVILNFRKGGCTEKFPAAFMRHNVEELRLFPNDKSLYINVDLVRKLSPSSLSIMEFRDLIDLRIAEKMLAFPLLGEKIQNAWNLILTQEFNITSDSNLFETQLSKNCLPLFTGKMFHQFTLTDEHSGYWISEKVGRKALLGKIKDIGQSLDYQGYRWVHRRIASNTNERTLITSMTPKNVFTEVNSTTIKVKESNIANSEMMYLCAITNSFGSS